MASDRERFLAELRAVGTPGGGGTFTVDIPAAHGKLGRYQLLGRGDYALKLVQSAVAAGASEVIISSDWGRFEMLHDGVAPSLEALNELLTYVLADQTDRDRASLRSLAIATNAVLAMRKSTVGIALAQGCVVFQAAQGVARPAIALPRGITTAISVAHRGRKPFMRAGALARLRSANDPPPEAFAVTRGCQWAPVPVWLNGQMLNLRILGDASSGFLRIYDADEAAARRVYQPVSFRHHLAQTRVPLDARVGQGIGVPQPHPRYLMRRTWDNAPSTAAPLCCNMRNGHVFERCQAVIALQVGTHLPPSITWVKDGVTMRGPPWANWLPTGIKAIACADMVPTDLSEMALVQGDAFTTTQRAVRVLAEALPTWLEESWPGPSHPHRVAQALGGPRYKASTGWFR